METTTLEWKNKGERNTELSFGAFKANFVFALESRNFKEFKANFIFSLESSINMDC